LARHSQLEVLEKSLVEVRDLFVRISAMVMEQGTLIQVIEYHADRTTHNVDKAAKTVEKARDYQIKALKKKTYIAIWIAVILLILVLIIVIF
jgi:t-SNARE complex subunit (syntaxin)